MQEMFNCWCDKGADTEIRITVMATSPEEALVTIKYQYFVRYGRFPALTMMRAGCNDLADAIRDQLAMTRVVVGTYERPNNKTGYITVHERELYGSVNLRVDADGKTTPWKGTAPSRERKKDNEGNAPFVLPPIAQIRAMFKED